MAATEKNCEDEGLTINSDAAAKVDDAIGAIDEVSRREAAVLLASSPARRRAICATHFTRFFESHLGGGRGVVIVVVNARQLEGFPAELLQCFLCP